MAQDPLSAVANEVAPAPTNFFSDGLGDNLLARYSRDRRLAESSAGVAEASRGLASAARGLEQDRWSRDRQAFDALTRSRQEEEVIQQREADALRGDFLTSLATDLNVEDPEYHRKAGELFAGLPPSLQKDPAVKSIMDSMARRADEVHKNRLMLGRAEEAQKDQLERIALRSKEMSALTEEDIKAAPLDPETGKPDQDWLQRRGALRLREAELEEFKTKEGIRQKNRLQIMDVRALRDQAKEKVDKLEDFLIEDKEAFPSAVDTLRDTIAEERNIAPDMAERLVDKDPRYREAKERDSKKFENAILDAMRYDDVEDYIAASGGKLSKEAREARRLAWEVAQEVERGRPETVAPTQTLKTLQDKPASSFVEVEHEGKVYHKRPGEERFRPGPAPR